ncbi:MAG TPA: hypothetical protein VFP50_15535 [Anaeromyxobacteraceae bacterium]|nr:hypothetical protein [Anaeromyxobacteraceae bacterium]
MHAVTLSSEHVYVVVRAVEGGRWTAALGIGGNTQDLRGSWTSADLAELAALVTWRRQLDALGPAAVHALRRPLVLRFAGPGNAWEHVAQAQPSTLDLERRPVPGEDKDERRALARARAGRHLGANDRSHIREVVARARELGAPYEDEAALLGAAGG